MSTVVSRPVMNPVSPAYQRYEYLVIFALVTDIGPRLNAYGQQGWRVSKLLARGLDLTANYYVQNAAGNAVVSQGSVDGYSFLLERPTTLIPLPGAQP